MPQAVLVMKRLVSPFGQTQPLSVPLDLVNTAKERDLLSDWN